MTIIGEAAARLAPEIKALYPQIEWGKIVAFRNIAVHAYFSVDWAIVWDTATQDAPELRRQVTAILDEDYPELQTPQEEDAKRMHRS